VDTDAAHSVNYSEPQLQPQAGNVTANRISCETAFTEF